MNYTFKNPSEIGVYVQTSNIKTISQVQKAIGADVICNFQMFTIATREANYVLKVDGKVIGWDGENYWGIGWNKGDKTFTYDWTSNMAKYDNFAGCVPIVRDGKIVKHVAGETYPSAIGGRRGHTVIGTKADGSIVIHCWPDGSKEACRIEDLGQKMLDLGCTNAINFDGGGSTQLICPDGKVTTLRSIYNFLYFKLDDDQKNSTGSQTEVKDACPYNEPVANIRFGSIGTGAAWVQWYLKHCGYEDIKVDGVFGVKSLAALKDFQEKWNLEVDGVCGVATRVALRIHADGTQTTVTKPATPPASTDNSKCPYAEPTSNIKFSMTGEGVKWLQWWLNYHGAKPELKVDGDFGAKTLTALNAFQKAAGLDVDGVCGKMTRAALKGDKVEVKEEDNFKGDEAYKKTLIEKREKMLDIIESFVGGLYVYGAQGQDATDSIIDWSARCFPQYTTAERAARMKKYVVDHPEKKLKVADCSGLFWAAENIVELPIVDGIDVDDATAEGLYNQYCYPISKSELQPLDLVFNSDLTHVAIVGRNGKVYEAHGSDIGIVVNDSVDDRLSTSIYGPKYGTYEQYYGSTWTKFGRLKIYKNIPYEK